MMNFSNQNHQKNNTNKVQALINPNQEANRAPYKVDNNVAIRKDRKDYIANVNKVANLEPNKDKVDNE